VASVEKKLTSWSRALRRAAGQSQARVEQCPDLYVDFAAERLAHAEIVWINERWFISQGLNAHLPDGLATASTWLNENFFFCVPCRYDDPSAFNWGRARRFLADRYGGPGLGHHGGSGRVGITAGFQAKGIGITPLVGRLADARHSNGAVSLEEAIREVIYSELAEGELPSGSIPVIAVIKTGTRTAWGEARAVVVRPDFFRAGYLERAQDYLPVDEANDIHIVDARRVLRSVRLVVAVRAPTESVSKKAEK
jgi:uncharacterized protein YdiU (UPF0061 family)